MIIHEVNPRYRPGPIVCTLARTKGSAVECLNWPVHAMGAGTNNSLAHQTNSVRAQLAELALPVAPSGALIFR